MNIFIAWVRPKVGPHPACGSALRPARPGNASRAKGDSLTRASRGAPTRWGVLLLLSLVATGCGDGPTGGGDPPVDLDALFAPATAAEVAAVEAEWAARDPGAVDVVVEHDSTVVSSAMRVRVVSHEMEGYRHYGAVITPTALAAPAPVGVFAHGGEDGVTVDQVLFLLALTDSIGDDFVWVVPSFRSEPLGFGGRTWTSNGDPSPWDRDVDDAMALLDVALDLEANADPDRVGVLGFSRGGTVALVMAERDDRVDRVVEFFGLTDFFDPIVQGALEEAIVGSVADVTGLWMLERFYLDPLARGEISMAEVRTQLVRRSPVLFADRLPAVQIHHGTADAVVPVSQAESLIATLEALGRTEPDFDATIYPGGTHSPFTLPGAVEATEDFLAALSGGGG